MDINSYEYIDFNPAELSFLDDRKYPRGIRNNNPGNILISKYKYLGLIEQGKDRSFCQFEKYWHGINALLYIIGIYYHQEKANTIEKLIYKYSRPNTVFKEYTAAICTGTGLRPRQVFKWRRSIVYLIIQEITRYENKGRNTMIHPELFAYVWIKLM